jgi:hypothetical protein
MVPPKADQQSWEHELAMRNPRADVFGNVDRRDQCPLLVTGRTDAPLFTRKRNEKLVPAIRAANARKSLARIAALQVVQDCRTDHGTPKSIAGLEPVGINLLEILVVLLYQPVKRRIPRLARTIERGILTVDNAHREF